jgi:hypothetical protein
MRLEAPLREQRRRDDGGANAWFGFGFGLESGASVIDDGGANTWLG